MAATILDRAIGRARGRIVTHFTTAGATAAEHAIAFAPRDRRLDRRLFRRLVEFGAVVETKPGHYWLDERRLADFRKEDVAKLLGALAIAGFAAAGAIALSG